MMTRKKAEEHRISPGSYTRDTLPEISDGAKAILATVKAHAEVLRKNPLPVTPRTPRFIGLTEVQIADVGIALNAEQPPVPRAPRTIGLTLTGGRTLI